MRYRRCQFQIPASSALLQRKAKLQGGPQTKVLGRSASCGSGPALGPIVGGESARSG